MSTSTKAKEKSGASKRMLNIQTVVALGANLGEARHTLETAIQDIQAMKQTTLLKHSSVYRSYPQGPSEQADYFNQVVLLQTDLAPHALLDELQAIEDKHGRQRTQHWGPRTLDLDIIVYGDMQCDDERLTIPHPQTCHRSFVLEPLAEIAPDLLIPGHGTAASLAKIVDDGLVYQRLDAS